MIWKTALHYARFWLFLALVSSQLTEEQKEQILDLHNQYRSMVIPEAADMQHMTWDDALSLVAEDYAAKCIWDHNPEVIDDYGENLFLTTGKLNVSKSIASWFDEHNNYDYDTNTCRSGMCGHYTQLVWAGSRIVGCASHFCPTVQKIAYRNATILVCNYDPAGNVKEELPYEKGPPCSKCPTGMDDCIKNACGEIRKDEKAKVLQ
ncbi:peptidase inhibitor 16-like [Silurus meridionalis]|nr:peptidase inhibitor 16-like [Silurus meridionalis]